MRHSLRTIITGCALALFASIAKPQAAKILEPCDNNKKCESGLYCIELRNSKSVCSKCTQSESASYSQKVDESCKSFGEGFTPSGSKAYQDATASDGRVPSSVFNDLFEQAKVCRISRETRESTCWNGGDETHKAAINQVGRSIDNIVSHRDQMANSKRVFYTDRSTYQNRFSTYQDKCVRVNFNNFQQSIDAAKVALGRTEKFDCSPLDTVFNGASDCVQAIKSFKNDAYTNTSNRMPDEFLNMESSAQRTWEAVIEIRKTARDKNMCR